MGMFDFIYSATDTVKGYTPGLSSIKNASVASYGLSASAVSIIDNAVRVNGIQKLGYYLPDGDRRAQIGSFAGKFAKNAAVYGFQEGYKLIPGGKAVGKIVSMTVNDMKSENLQSDRETKTSSKEKSTKISTPVIVSMTANNIKSENCQTDRETKASSKEKSAKKTSEKPAIADLVMDRKPEDVLRVFMMKEFIGTSFLNDLIVPGAKKSK